MSHDHDHGGDRLGEEAPVESIDAKTMTFREVEHPATYMVFPQGERNQDRRWLAWRTATRDVEFVDEDGVNVINWALERLGETAPDADQKGLVHVTAPDNDLVLESWNTVHHTTDGTGLIIEPNFWMRADDREAFVLAGDGLHLEFSKLRNWGTLAVRDLGLSNSTVRAGLCFGGQEGIWLGDAENQVHPTPTDAGYTQVHMSWARKTDVPYGIKMESGPDARFENYRWRFPLLFGGDTAVVFGDRNEHDSVNDHVFYGDIDAGSSGSDVLIEFNDSHNAAYLKDYLPARGDQDVIIRPSADDCFVLPIVVPAFAENALRVQRESPTATDMSKIDQFKGEVFGFDLFPDSLTGYATERTGNGQIRLHSGHVEQTTGETPDSRANLYRQVGVDYDRLSFDHHGVLQTNVQVSDNAGQKAWFLWGDREGPGVGWRIVDDRLEGYVHNGDTAETVPLREGFDPGTAWNLTAFYNPPAGVHYVVEETATGQAETPAEDRHLRVEAEATVGVPDPVDTEANLSVSPTDERSTAYQIMAMELTTTTPEEKSIRWSTWRNHQYPALQ